MSDEFGLLSQALEPYSTRYPGPVWAEQDAENWEQALPRALGAALTAANLSATDVRALGLTGQLDSCLAVDDEGNPLSPCLIWMDRRASAEIDGMPAETIRALSGVMLDPGHMAAKIRWLQRHHPKGRAAKHFHQAVSFMVRRLTGESVFDHGLASTTMLYSLETRNFDGDLLDVFEIDRTLLPAIADAADVAGRLTESGAALSGLPTGIPVAVGTGDDFAGPIGAGVVHPGVAVASLGTAEVVGALHGAPRIDSSGLVETHAYPGGSYYIENPGWLSGGALMWFIQTFGLESVDALDRLAAEAPVGCDGVTFLPALSGAMTPEWNPDARSCFYGLTSAHGLPHLARAVHEGNAFAMADVIARLVALGVRVDTIRLIGGGAKSAIQARIRASAANLPVELPVEQHTTPVGAAMLGALAAGIVSSLDEAAARVGGVAAAQVPDADALSATREAHARARQLYESLRPMYGWTAGE